MQGGGGGRGPGQQSTPRGMSPAQGAQEAERRLGKPCFHVGQRVPGFFGCVAFQFQIRNRKALPTCPQCGEIIWCYLDDGPRPVPEGEDPVQVQDPTAGQQPVKVEEGVDLGAPAAPVIVEEGVKLE